MCSAIVCHVPQAMCSIRPAATEPGGVAGANGFDPQVTTLPLFSRATVCEKPAAISCTRAGSGGTVDSPARFDPQHKTSPSARSTTLCEVPAAMRDAGARPSGGIVCPKLLPPQPIT